ncbi:polyprenyl synthetase [Lachnoanaerobaculum saburreum F0468]|uniref:Farnesyl diphosphate synthase n=1 Tax=Lachnoanaerobaculum saburreum F0468 TaxID=1095750 RepID=I0R5N2_9FIRM|nr:farnesyl diphosphate synthase [Lachnoanaerobaculum saburreum]EIC94990.1 polyprenyl synthetase [Lachnoanaerobaculum saburreum F0468]
MNKDSLSKIEKLIESFFYNEDELNKNVIKASNEAIRNGGKRLRPLIMFETYKAISGDEYSEEIIAPFLAAIEMIHTFSLIHDDLPAMDNDRLRRGKPTTWVSYGEDMAILAGDMLSVQAFEIISKKMQETDDFNILKRMSRAMYTLARATGAFGMIGGQCVDVEYSGKKMTEEVMKYIYALKTGALLAASFVVGGILAGANETEVGLLKKAGSYVGEAFQIRDDYLDIVADEKELGKPTHSDEKNLKITYVNIVGIDESLRRIVSLSENAKKCLSEVRGDMSSVVEIIDMMVNRTS